MSFYPFVATSSGGGTATQPYQFNVTSATYGAVGDGQIITDALITSGQPTLTTVSSTPFKPSDQGKIFQFRTAGATAAGATLVGTISAYISSSSVTLSVNASTTVNSPGAIFMWATDDTTAFQNAVNAATTYASAANTGGSYAEVLIPPAPKGYYYGIGGALSHANSGNAQITIPVIATTQNKVTLVFKGTEDAGSVRHWQQTVPQMGASTLVSFGHYATSSAQTTDITANGNPAVIGGPTAPNGYGTGATLFSNMMPVLKGLTILTTYCSNGITYGAFNFIGCANAELFDVSYGTTGTFAGNDFNSPSSFAAGSGSFGGIMPNNGNNIGVAMRNVNCQGGYAFGLGFTEHCDIAYGMILYCWSGAVILGSYAEGQSANGMNHKVKFTQLGIEGCTNTIYLLGAGSAGTGPWLEGSIDIESGASGSTLVADNDSGTALLAARGTIHVTGTYTVGNLGTPHPTGLRIIDEKRAPGNVTPPSVPATTVAQTNTFWRDAAVTVTAGTATISAIAVDGVTTNLTSGTFLVPAGASHSITLTYTVGTPVWTWELL